MTTPERLRRRQRIESTFIVILTIALVAAALWFNGQASAQQTCLSTYISINSQTTKIRSDLVSRESKTTRKFLLDATDPDKVKTREEFQKIRARYKRSLASIDAARAANPVQPFPKGVCD